MGRVISLWSREVRGTRLRKVVLVFQILALTVAAAVLVPLPAVSQLGGNDFEWGTDAFDAKYVSPPDLCKIFPWLCVTINRA